jgi:predicted HTH domain antitoxin
MMIEISMILTPLALWMTLSPSRACLADEGETSGPEGEAPETGGEAPGLEGRPREINDILFKSALEIDSRDFLRKAGLNPDLIKNPTRLPAELTNFRALSIKRPDCVLRLDDGSILIIEFQSAAKDSDLFRFYSYGAAMTLQHTEEYPCDRVRILVVFASEVTKRLPSRYPNESAKDRDCVGSDIKYVYLGEENGLDEHPEKLWPIIKDWKPGMPAPALPRYGVGDVFFAMMGGTKNKDLDSQVRIFLAMARKLSQITENADIIGVASFCALARRVPLTQEEKNQCREDFRNMKLDEVFVADIVTDGKFSFLQKENETLSAENKSKDGAIETLFAENKSKDGTIETLSAEKETLSAENKSKDGTIETLVTEREDLRRTINVLALLAENKSVGEISEILEISPSEVAKILERVERDKKRLS